MQQPACRVSLAGLALWFILLRIAFCMLPNGWQASWISRGWFTFSISCVFVLVSAAISLAAVCDFFDQEAAPLLSNDKNEYVGIVGFGVFCIVLSAFLNYLHSGDSPSRDTATVQIDGTAELAEAEKAFHHEQTLRLRIEQLRSQQTLLNMAIKVCEENRQLVVDRLRRLGPTTERDLPSDPETRIYTQELLEIKRTLKAVKSRAKEVSLTIIKGESLLRRIDRQAKLHDVGIGVPVAEDLLQLRVEIDEMLKNVELPMPISDAIHLDEIRRAARL